MDGSGAIVNHGTFTNEAGATLAGSGLAITSYATFDNSGTFGVPIERTFSQGQAIPSAVNVTVTSEDGQTAFLMVAITNTSSPSNPGG